MQDATASTDSLPLYASVYPVNTLRMAKRLTTASLDDNKLDGTVQFALQSDLKAIRSTPKRLSQPRLPPTARRSSDKRCSAVSFESQYGMPLDAQTRQNIFGASTLARPSHIERSETVQWHICLLSPSASPAEEAEADIETETKNEQSSTSRPKETHSFPASFSRSETGCEAATKSKGAIGTQMQGSARAVCKERSSASSMHTHTHMPSRLSPRSVNLRTALVLPALSTATSPTTARLSARMLLQSCIGAELENLGLRRLFGSVAR